jgi:hypothetical protein
MRGALPFIVLVTLSLTASCVRAPMLANAGDAVDPPTATDAVSIPASVIEMPPLYVDARDIYARKIEGASAASTVLCSRQLACPAVRVRRAYMYQRADGTLWTVVRLNACGEERVYEEKASGWSDATSRLR